MGNVQGLPLSKRIEDEMKMVAVWVSRTHGGQVSLHTSLDHPVTTIYLHPTASAASQYGAQRTPPQCMHARKKRSNTTVQQMMVFRIEGAAMQMHKIEEEEVKEDDPKPGQSTVEGRKKAQQYEEVVAAPSHSVI
jgi:hypothetical protein